LGLCTTLGHVSAAAQEKAEDALDEAQGALADARDAIELEAASPAEEAAHTAVDEVQEAIEEVQDALEDHSLAKDTASAEKALDDAEQVLEEAKDALEEVEDTEDTTTAQVALEKAEDAIDEAMDALEEASSSQEVPEETSPAEKALDESRNDLTSSDRDMFFRRWVYAAPHYLPHDIRGEAAWGFSWIGPGVCQQLKTWLRSMTRLSMGWVLFNAAPGR
jgi:tetratricopeptide (TPR) repeat protein